MDGGAGAVDGYLRDVLVLIKLGEIFPFPVLFASAPASDLFLSAENYHHCYSGRRTRKRDYRNKMVVYLIYF